jgi:preprotein translocase subunit SecG
MDTNKIIQLATIIIAGLLIISILLQNQSSGLGGIFGGEGNIYRTKRGAEKVIFIATIVLAILFFGLAAVRLFLINTI